MKKTYKYQLPQNKEVKGTNVRIENGEILVDVEFEEKFEPKDGDFCISDNGYVFIFKNEFTSNHFERSASCYYGIDANGNLDYNLFYIIEHGRYATEQEKANFLERLEKEYHKRWNAETKQLEDIRWKPKEGETYWFIEHDGSVSSTLNNKYEYIQWRRIGRNNCFKTKEAAQKVADQIKEILKNSKAE